MSRPNLFRIATSELSQDAFLVWLMQWADPSNMQYDSALCAAGQDFIRLLISKQYDDFSSEIQKVEAGRQWKNIDVWAKVNDKFLIVIEDKTGTGVHSGQLDRYGKAVEEHCASKELKPVYLYVKTQDESEARATYAKGKGYGIINRKDLLEFFSSRLLDNDIYKDFVSHLGAIEERASAFRIMPVRNWSQETWRGFYSYLDVTIPVKDWCYVANPSGGFLGLWWHYTSWKDYNVYLQIEKGKDGGRLCFKINQVTDNHYNIRSEWAKRLRDHANGAGLKEELEFTKFHKGNNMTVAYIGQHDWLGPDDSIIDLEQVLARLHKYERFLDECVSRQ